MGTDAVNPPSGGPAHRGWPPAQVTDNPLFKMIDTPPARRDVLVVLLSASALRTAGLVRSTATLTVPNLSASYYL